MSSSHTLSIISVSFNEAAHIPRLKAAIDALVCPEGIAVESILVDGGSTDETVVLAREAGFDRVEVLPGARIPVCRNRGAAVATGDWIAYLDADCEPAPEWVGIAAPWLSRGPIVIGWPVSPPDECTWVQRAWHIHWANKNPTWTELYGARVVTHQAFRLITTRNMLLRREVFDAIDGFDENLVTGEDTDFVFRAFHHGLPVVAIPDLHVVHHGEPATLGAFFRQQLWHANRSSYRTILREEQGGGGGNAPLFAALFLGCAVLALVGIGCALALRSLVPLAAVLPLAGLVGGPAVWIAAKARAFRMAPALAVLYAAYGFARAIDLIGLHRSKPSWKS